MPSLADDLLDRLRTANAGRDPARLTRKFMVMRRDPFAFLRGSCHLFYDAWPIGSGLDTAPLAWCCGDLHLENFGSYKGDNRLTYFDLNDFDEAALVPAPADVTRLLTSIHLAADRLERSPEDAAALGQRFLDAYYATLATGRPGWIERATADGLIAVLLRGLKRRSRGDLLDAKTRRKKGGRKLLFDGVRALPATDEEQVFVRRLLDAYAAPREDRAFYEVLDVGRRIAGTASLGLERYVVLVEGRGSPDGNFLLDLKLARPSAVTGRLPVPQSAWPSDAARVVTVARQARIATPARLDVLADGGRSFVLRELQPAEDRLLLTPATARGKRFDAVMSTMGMLVASSHLRTGGWRGAAIADEWIEFGERQALRKQMVAFAQGAAEDVRAEWQAFATAFDAGALAA